MAQTPSGPAASNRRRSANKSKPSSTPDTLDCKSPGQTEPDLLYLRILNDAVEESPGPAQLHTTSSAPDNLELEGSLTVRNCLSTKLSHLDEIDREYLAKKRVFDLPPRHYLDALVKTYFDRVHPFCPIINRADFVRCYQSGDCSLLLLYVVLTAASVHAPADVLSSCGFDNISAAQESFFSKTRLLYDFATADEPLLMLQVSIILCSTVVLARATDRDFGFWFHNAIRLVTKLNLRDLISVSTTPRKVLKMYRRLWWTLYSLDVFHVFIDTRRSRLFENSIDITPRMEDDGEDENVSGGSSSLLSAVTPQQKALPVVLCELCRIFGECLSIVKSQPRQDYRQMMQPLDAWRASLASKMHVDGNTGSNVYYVNVQAMSYRFECILCRLIRRTWQHSGQTDWSEWTRRRLRSAVLELDMIAMKVLANGSLAEFPIPFVTTITALLALHIESALDPSETELVRSMSRISINQTMLLLTQGREIPAIKRALPIFEGILAKNNLSLVPPNRIDQSNAQASAESPPPDKSVADTHGSLHTQVEGFSPQLEQWEYNPSLDVDFLDFDFLDNWQPLGHPSFPG